MNNPKALEALGFDDWFRGRLSRIESGDRRVARVTAVNRDNFLIHNEEGEVQAELTGKMLFGTESKTDLPAVGDWVLAQYVNEDTFAIIHEVLPRKNALRRKVAGKEVDFQVLAANIDTAFIMQSVDRDFNLRRLERYLVMIQESDIYPTILLSKCDLTDEADLNSKIEVVREIVGEYDLIPFSNETLVGLDEIQRALKSGHTACLLGSSGVGKTTLLNRLIGEERFAVDRVREKDGKGRHTTARRQLICLPTGGLIIDTPGMRELGLFDMDAGLSETFEDIHSIAQDCRFKDCTHTHEAGCAVLEAVKKGTLDGDRYQNYLKIKKEAAYYQMSYLEKRRRDKMFGKMVKQVLKNKVKKRH